MMPIPDSTNPIDLVFNARLDAERKAWDSLGRYKFYMFGYHAAAWVKYNQLIAEMDPAEKLPNPFTDLVKTARIKLDK
jgi:hypothetical protein